MNSQRTPWGRIVWVILFALLLCYAIWISVVHLHTSFRLALAKEQVSIFDEMVTQAQEEAPAEAAQSLAYIVWYYPSGTKQVAGSRVDQVVELARKNAIRAVINDLRRRTGEDFGDDPEGWIENLRKDEPEPRER